MFHLLGHGSEELSHGCRGSVSYKYNMPPEVDIQSSNRLLIINRLVGPCILDRSSGRDGQFENHQTQYYTG